MNFDTNYDNLIEYLSNYISGKLSSHQKEVKQEIKNLLEKLKTKLKKWTLLLEKGKIDLEEFKWLLQSQKDLIIINTLHQAGLTKNTVGRIKRDLLQKIYFDLSKFKF